MRPFWMMAMVAPISEPLPSPRMRH